MKKDKKSSKLHPFMRFMADNPGKIILMVYSIFVIIVLFLFL